MTTSLTEAVHERSVDLRNTLEQDINLQKSLMIAVATGGPRIQERNAEYIKRREQIRDGLSKIGLPDPNSFADLWAWYGKWSDGSFPSYQSRRQYITELYQPLLDSLQRVTSSSRAPEPTGWTRVDRGVDAARSALETAKSEEEFQTVGLLSREAIISLAQAVFDPSLHATVDGVRPSSTDANRMLEAYIAQKLAGGTNEVLRKHAKAALALAVELQHKRTAQFRDAAICAEATQSLINLIAIVDGRRDP